MKIIGHRGAAGLALENTVESIHAAIKAGVDGIEFDIRTTKDGKLVLSHDRHLARVSEHDHHIHKHNLAKLRKVPLHNGQVIATLHEAVRAASDTPIVVEGKENNWAEPLADFINKHPIKDVKVISFNHAELYTFHELQPEVAVYAVEQTNPFEVIRTARSLGFTGIDLNFWLLNPLTYYLARRYKLEIIVFTVNKPWLGRFLKFFYPDISVTTNVPDKLQFLRKPQRKVT